MLGFNRPSLKKRIEILEENYLGLHHQFNDIVHCLYGVVPDVEKRIGILFDNDQKLNQVRREFGSLEILRDNFKKLLDFLELQLETQPYKTFIKKKDKK
jgi:hypothetical protein